MKTKTKKKKKPVVLRIIGEPIPFKTRKRKKVNLKTMTNPLFTPQKDWVIYRKFESGLMGKAIIKCPKPVAELLDSLKKDRDKLSDYDKNPLKKNEWEEDRSAKIDRYNSKIGGIEDIFTVYIGDGHGKPVSRVHGMNMFS